MKLNKFLCGTMTLLAIGLTACSNDDQFLNNGKVEADATRYLSIQLTSPVQGTRAFENGTTNESKVTRLDFLFYDATGNPTSTPQTFKKDDLNDEFVDGPFESGNVTRIWTSVVPVQLVQGQNLPAQVLCVVNGDANAVNELQSKSLDDVRDVVRNYFNNGADFLMTNSVYFGQNVLTGQANQRLCATPINANSQLFATEAEATAAITAAGADGATDAQKAALVNIYVERLAAKVGLTLTANTVSAVNLANGAGGANVTIEFTPQYWLMNAVANQNYITKRYGVMEDGVAVMKPTYTQINDAFAGTAMASTWNDAPNHRSYWGCSPSYYTANYPLVSDQVNDLAIHSGDGYVAGTYQNKYYSYNEVVAQAAGTGVNKQALAATNGGFAVTNTGAAATGYIYTRETTTALNKIQNVAENPAATVASAVIVGQYKVSGADAPATFYVDPNNNNNYNSTDKTGTQGTYYGTEAAARTALQARQFIVFTDVNGTTPAGVDAFVVKHPDYVVRQKLANPNIAGRLVTLQLEAVPETTLYYFDGTGYVPVTAANLAEVNAQLVSVGYLNMYNNGLAFFNIPIRHLGFRDASYANGKYDWADMQLGELGLVRNHVYTINVTGISGIGTGLRSADQPIVPAKDEVNQYIAMRLNILAWNVVNAWNIEL